MPYSDTMEAVNPPPDARSTEQQSRLPIEEVYHLLSSDRRRQVISLLEEQGQRADVGDLATQVALIEEGSRDDEADSQVRKAVYVSLVQCHLPKMDDYGLIEYDSDRQEVHPTPLLSEVAQCDCQAQGDLVEAVKHKIRAWLLA
jgi:predicted transcriptional regulator